MNIQDFLFASQMKACLSLNSLHDRACNQALAVGRALCPGTGLAARHSSTTQGSISAKSSYEFVIDVIQP